jgi:RNA polymerase sigma-70 factor (ECF subfamily)
VRDDEHDDTLARRAADGDSRALDALLRDHSALVHGVCRRILGNPDDALDATQEALLSIARKIGSFDGRSKFSTWAYRVATNAALDESRRRARRPLPSESLPESSGHPGHATTGHSGTGHSGTAHSGTEASDTGLADRLDVDAALAHLTPEYRAAVALRDLVGMDYAEIAAVLDIPPGTVRSRISRGRAALADLLGNRETPSEHPTT